MARSRDHNDGIPGLLRRMLGESEASAALTLIAIVLAVMAVGTFVLWNRFGGYVLDQPQYRLTSESIEITPQPPWISTTDVRGESVLAGSLNNLHIRQSDVTLRVAQAFSMHPWVKKVTHVSKRYPARVLVDVVYRRPVAMVEVNQGWLPVDNDGVLLPTADFSPEATRQYLRISAGKTSPANNLAGSAWGDERVAEAARVADYLGPHANQLKFEKIVAYRGPNDVRGNPDYNFVILTRNGTKVIWGRSPSKEQSGEPFAEQKLARLQEFAERNGGLDVLDPGQTIDLRHADRLDVATLPDDFK